MTGLVRRSRSPLRPAVASSEPRIIEQVVEKRVILRVGKKQQKAAPEVPAPKDGKDGTNAFPTGSEKATAYYTPDIMAPHRFRLESVEPEEGATHFLAARPDTVLLKSGNYRVTVCGALGKYSPLGHAVEVFKSDKTISISHMLPPVIELPARLCFGMTRLELSIIVEYVSNDAAG